jgi:hypothetical protein
MHSREPGDITIPTCPLLCLPAAVHKTDPQNRDTFCPVSDVIELPGSFQKITGIPDFLKAAEAAL